MLDHLPEQTLFTDISALVRARKVGDDGSSKPYSDEAILVIWYYDQYVEITRKTHRIQRCVL